MSNLEKLNSGKVRNDWTVAEIEAVYNQPFNDLMFAAQSVHRQHFNPNEVQTSTLLSIKTGACPEDCAYCPQSGHYNTGLSKEKLMAVQEVVEKAKQAKKTGATRFCMGAAWRSPRDKDLDVVLEMVRQVKDLGLETCVTLGMLTDEQAGKLAEAGLDYYNHNLDTSPEYYEQIITTRSYDNRLDTLQNVRDAGINVCSGGIIGMGENTKDRYGLLKELANMPEHPQSVPINMLVAVPGTPLGEVEKLDEFDFIRMIATARIIMPQSYVRLSAGREDMNEQTQSLCFLAGANSIFYGEKLLTTANPEAEADAILFERLGINPEKRHHSEDEIAAEAAEFAAQAAEKATAKGKAQFYDATQVK
ncbi:biotin synthase BioB [Kangiella sediminilitoris]|uniref:Biotin synthase n=1 Tax=Kangiella sediminilitoris TaxID=1144748 RepID=A0A1B3B8S7_9GAMM|nr:biotin synthase BioB [Kangiella sediminilitoris]AOE49181.1 Biotin synthase [Kangiella sediminilitoris]